MLRTENCRSKVVVDGAESAEYTVGHGLREGAVLSPVLYVREPAFYGRDGA